MLSFIKNKPIFFKYLMSYITILIIPILILVYFINSQFIGILKDEMVDNNINTLNRVMYIVDKNILQLQSIHSHMILNRRLDSSKDMQEPLAALETIDELSKYTLSSSFIKDICIHYYQDQYIYTSSSTYTIHTFINQVYKYSNWNELNFNYDINTFTKTIIRPSEEVKLINQQKTLKLITLIYPILKKTGPTSTATVLFLLDEQFFINIMKDNMNESRANCLILDQNNQIITCINKTDYISSIDFQQFSDNENQKTLKTLEIDNENYILSYVRSGETGWKYISLMPVQYVMKKTFSVQIKFYVLLANLLLLGCCVIYFNMRTNYKPIKQLTTYSDRICKEDGSHRNELEMVKSTIDYLFNQNLQLKKDTQTALKDYFLLSLLKGHIKTREELNNMGMEFGIKFEKPNYLVFIVLYHEQETLDSFSSPEIAEQFNAVLKQFFYGYVLDYRVQEELVVIISLDENEELRLQDVFESLHQHLTEAWNIPVTIGVGSICRDTQSIPISYSEAASAIDYKLIKGTNTIIYSYELSKNVYSGENYPQKELNSLKYLIKQGNLNEIEIILSYLSDFIKTSGLPVSIAKGLCFELVTTISKAILEAGRELLFAKNDCTDISALSNFESADELISTARNICITFCSLLNERKVTQNDCLITNIIHTITENYVSNDFSIQNMAEQYDMTLTGLSLYFKNQTGQTIIDYITNLRIEKAKILLKTSNLTLNEITYQVGYLNTSSFIRRFKQLTGLTPRQYAEENKSI